MISKMFENDFINQSDLKTYISVILYNVDSFCTVTMFTVYIVIQGQLLGVYLLAIYRTLCRNTSYLVRQRCFCEDLIMREQ